jgi:hypothetical protein
MQKVAIIIPAYNEEVSIKKVIDDIKTVSIGHDFVLDIIVVNDCSIDKTAEIISKEDCIAIHLPMNLGIGGAMQTGFKYAYEHKYDYAIQVDGDGQHPAFEISKLIEYIKENNVDVVIGSRFLSNKGGFRSTLIRRIGIYYFKFLINLLVGKNITDSTSGFRIINAKTLEIVSNYYPDEYPEPESIMMYIKNNLNIAEVPVDMLERQGGKSSIDTFSGIYYIVKVSLSIIFTLIKFKRRKKIC